MDKNELIALYLTKKLSLEEQKEFDHLLTTNSEFAQEVAFQEDLKIVINIEEQEQLKAKLASYEAEENTSINYSKWFIAATVTVLLGLSSFWYFNRSIDSEKLYIEHFEPYRNVVQPIIRSEGITNLKTKAFTAYEHKNFSDAIHYFDEMLLDSYDETIAFYKANALLSMNKTSDAISIFEANLKTSDSLDDKNSWYLALAYLKLQNTNKTKEILTALESSSTFKNKTIKKLLRALN